VYHTNPHTVQKLQVEIEAFAVYITGDVCVAVDSFVVCLQQVHKVIESHTKHVFT